MRIALGIVGIGILFLGLGPGCQSAAATKSNGTGSGAGSSHLGGNGNVGTNDGGNGTGGTPALPSASLTLKSASAHFDGRLGNRVRLSITGEQTASNFGSVAVTALDSNGNAINWFDTNLDSTLDSSTGFLVPQAIPNEATFSFDVLIPLSKALLDWSQAKVSLYDRADAVSNELSITVEQQPVRSSGQACAPTAKADRCPTHLECSASSSTCVNHTGPSLSQVAYI